jgi:hypothetical protein
LVVFQQSEEAMSKWNRFLTATVLGLLIAGMAAADTLELKDGRVLHGRYLGGTQAVLRFEVKGEVQTFSTIDIVALTFTGRYAGGAPPSVAPPAMTPADAPPHPHGLSRLTAGFMAMRGQSARCRRCGCS